jgi:hypothetical protein
MLKWGVPRAGCRIDYLFPELADQSEYSMLSGHEVLVQDEMKQLNRERIHSPAVLFY